MDLVNENIILKKIKEMIHMIQYKKPKKGYKIDVMTLADAYFNIIQSRYMKKEGS